MTWNEIQDYTMCITPTEWNTMVAVIEALVTVSCPSDSEVTFTMWEDCSEETGQVFKFDVSSDDSQMYGGADANDDLWIYVNSTDLCPLIHLEGGADAIIKIPQSSEFYISSCTDEEWLKVDATGAYFRGVLLESGGACPTKGDLPFTLYNDCATLDEVGFLFSISGAISTLEGSDDAGDDLILKANSNDTYPFIELSGNAEIYLDVASEEEIIFREANTQFMLFDQAGEDSFIYGGAATTQDLFIYANTADAYPFIQLEGDAEIYLDVGNDEEIIFREAGNVFFQFDHSGDDSKLYGGDATTEDLFIYANSNDTYPFITLEGNAEIYLDVNYDEEIIFREGGSQFFLFDHSGDDSLLYGGDATTEDLLIYANSNDTYPFIALHGNDDIQLEVGVDEEIVFKEGGSQFFLFDHSGDDSLLYGSAAGDGDLKIIANTVDTYPFIRLEGNAEIALDVASDEEIIFSEGAAQFFLFDQSGITSFFYGGDDTGDALRILANDTDSYPYISLEGDDYVEIRTTNDIYFYEQAEQMFKFELSGISSTMYGSDDTGDDLLIYPNSVDSCSLIKLFGDAGITNQIKYGSIFEISTCSDEILFEVDSGNKIINFHCLEADEFRLENRTSNPSSPTCVGRIWIRTDL